MNFKEITSDRFDEVFCNLMQIYLKRKKKINFQWSTFETKTSATNVFSFTIDLHELMIEILIGCKIERKKITNN